MQRKKMKPKSQLTFQGFLTVLGGFISHVHLGCIFIWGNIQPYVASYLKENDNELDTGQVFITLPIGIFAMTIGLYCGNKALRKMHPRVVYGIGAMINIIATFMTSYVKHLHAFLVLYGFIGGFGIGFAYIAPLFAAWLHFPDRKGFVSGIILAGFGLGVFIYNLVTNELVNPNNLPPDAFLTSDSSLYPTYVVDAEFLLVYTCDIWLFIDKYTKTIRFEATQNGSLESIQYTQRYQSVFFQQIQNIAQKVLRYGYFLINAFKVYGQRNKFDDQFLSMVGSIGALVNCASRLIAAWLIDHFSFQSIYGLLLIKQFAITCSIYWVTGNQTYFLLWYCLSQICYGAHFSITPVVCAKIFGLKIGVSVYSRLYASYALSALFGAILVDQLLDEIGYLMFFNLMALFTAISFGLLQFLSTQKFIPQQIISSKDRNVHENTQQNAVGIIGQHQEINDKSGYQQRKNSDFLRFQSEQ
eukprot:403358853